MKNTLHFTFLRTLMILAFGLFFNGAWGQLALPSGNIYEQNFNGLPNLPQGWTVRSNGSQSNLGSLSSIATSSATANAWNQTSGNFRNVASAKSPLVSNSTSNNQFSSTDRALAVRPSGSFGDPGASFVLQVQNTAGKKDFVLVLKHMIFDAQPRVSEYVVEYSKESDGNSNWVSIGSFSTSGSWGATDATYNFGSSIDNFNGTLWIRVRGEESSSSGSRDTYGIDDFVLTWSDIIAVPTSTTWNGLVWSNGVPTSSLDAIIEGNFNTSTTGLVAKSLTVNSGIFTVDSGSLASIQGAIVNNAGENNFIVKSGGNLIQTTTVANTGAITVERNSAPIVRLDHTLWSSPVTAQNLYAFSPNTLTNRFYVYNTPTDTYITTGISATSTFVPGKGFGVRAPNNHPTTATQWLGTFKGIPNNGEVTFAASTAGTGFNLVGNPYPSAISGTAFINANPSLNGTLYFYAHSLSMNAQGVFPPGTNYATWNLTGSTVATTTATNSGVVPNGTIQVGQGFIVKATSAGDVTFTNAMRTADTNNQFFRTANQFTANSEVEKHRLWLDLTNPEGTAFNQILIGYVTGATEGFDRGYDGLAFGNTGSYISTKIEDSEYAIQAKSLPFQASDVVPVSFKAETAGSYTISLSNMDGLFSGDQTVFLKDNTTNTLNDLKSGSYTFTTTEGTFNNRFEVVYQTTLSTPQSEFAANSVVAFKRANVLNVETKNFEIASVKAYDVQGRLVYSKSGINASAVQLSDLQVQNGVLLLQVTSTEGTSATIKVIY